MSTSVELLTSPGSRTQQEAIPLNEAVWQAWVADGRARDRENSLFQVKTVKWASIAGLLTAAGLWANIAPYELVVRLLVAAAAMISRSLHPSRLTGSAHIDERVLGKRRSGTSRFRSCRASAFGSSHLQHMRVHVLEAKPVSPTAI